MGIREKLGWSLVCALALTAAAALAGVINAGPLDPPDPPAETDGVLQPGTPINSLPFAIATPGRYYLTRSLTSPGPGNGITVNASEVDLDLGGFTLQGLNSGAGVQLNAFRVRIHNGSMRNWRDGIAGAGVHTTIEQVHIASVAEEGIDFGAGFVRVVVRDCSVTDAGFRGITLLGAATVSGCRVTNAAQQGILVGAGSVVTDCVISDGGFGISLGAGSVLDGCVISDNNLVGISAGSGSVINDVTVAAAVGVGISVGGQGNPTVISNCTVRGTLTRAGFSARGIEASDNTIVDSCVVEGNSGGGISAGPFSIVRNNVVGDNGGSGISVGDGSLVENNTVADNAGDGIIVSAGSRVLNNTLRFNLNGTANAAGVHLVGEGNYVEGSDLSSNDIGILSDVGNNTILNNTARNHTGGHYLLQADDIDGVVVTDANDGTNAIPHFNNTP